MVKDCRSHLETLRKQAAESALISTLTTVPQKRELFARHAEHLNALAAEVERAKATAANEKASAYQTDPGRGVHPAQGDDGVQPSKEGSRHGPDSRR